MTITFKETDFATATDGDVSITLGTNINWLGISLARATTTGAPTGMTWDGDTCVKTSEQGTGGSEVSVWHINDPANNGTFTLAWTGTASDSVQVIVWSFDTDGKMIFVDSKGIENFNNDFFVCPAVTMGADGGAIIYAARKAGSGNAWSAVEDGASSQQGAYEISTDATESATYGDAGDAQGAITGSSFEEVLPGSFSVVIG